MKYNFPVGQKENALNSSAKQKQKQKQKRHKKHKKTKKSQTKVFIILCWKLQSCKHFNMYIVLSITTNQLYMQHCSTSTKHTELAQGQRHRMQESNHDFLFANTKT